ncbi:hypothetical protein A4G99_03490 [Haladaptatus sp. R4]|nr:hypothetical protein A4G99_03490 [Haladaptatus sp. R4]
MHVFEFADELRSLKPCPVTDSDHRVDGILYLLVDHLRGVRERDVKRRDHHLAREDGDTGARAGVDADDGPSVLTTERGQRFLDGLSRPLRVGHDDRESGLHLVVLRPDDDPCTIREVRTRFDRGEANTPVA